MKEILLAVGLIAIFVFGYFVADRIVDFVDKHVRGNEKPCLPPSKRKGCGGKKHKGHEE